MKHQHQKKSKLKLNKKVETLREKVQQQTKRIENMANIIESLKEKNLVAYDHHDLLSHNIGGTADEIFKNHVKNSKVQSEYGRHYSKEMKQFVMTLHYYSPKAYDIVGKHIGLPYSSSIRTIAMSVDYEPGYLLNVIMFIGKMVVEKTWMSDIVLFVDAIA